MVLVLVGSTRSVRRRPFKKQAIHGLTCRRHGTLVRTKVRSLALLRVQYGGSPCVEKGRIEGQKRVQASAVVLKKERKRRAWAVRRRTEPAGDAWKHAAGDVCVRALLNPVVPKLGEGGRRNRRRGWDRKLNEMAICETSTSTYIASGRTFYHRVTIDGLVGPLWGGGDCRVVVAGVRGWGGEEERGK